MPHSLYSLYIKIVYKRKIGKKCNLRNPQAYTEKIQWSKLYRTNDLITQLSDKIAVRKWVKSRIGSEYLIPCIGGIYKSADEIDFDSLPDSFVIKANHGSGFIIIVNNKCEADFDYIRKKIKGWMKTNYAFVSMETQYKSIRPLIYIEKNLLSGSREDLPDYKFFCFNGKVFCSYTMIDYAMNHSSGKIGFFDRDYVLMPYHRKDYEPITEQLKKPKNYELMVEIAEKLSRGFSHVRVDLYNVDGKIYFGEMTFTNASGLCQFEPEKFDRILGEQWDLDSGI